MKSLEVRVFKEQVDCGPTKQSNNLSPEGVKEKLWDPIFMFYFEGKVQNDFTELSEVASKSPF